MNAPSTPGSTRKKWNWSPTFRCPSLFVRRGVPRLNHSNEEPLSDLCWVSEKFCKVELSSLESVPTPCPRSYPLLLWGAKTKRPGALEPGIQSSRSMVEMITRLTMSQRSFPIFYKSPFLASEQYLNRGQLPQSAIYENFFVPLAW